MAKYTKEEKQKAEDLLKSSVTNSTVIMERLVELWYIGGLTTVKNFIKANKDLVPARRLTVQLTQGFRSCLEV